MKKIILLIISVLLLTGCTDKKECIKSHEEHVTCVRTYYIGRHMRTIVVPCTKTVCDEYKEVEE